MSAIFSQLPKNEKAEAVATSIMMPAEQVAARLKETLWALLKEVRIFMLCRHPCLPWFILPSEKLYLVSSIKHMFVQAKHAKHNQTRTPRTSAHPSRVFRSNLVLLYLNSSNRCFDGVSMRKSIDHRIETSGNNLSAHGSHLAAKAAITSLLSWSLIVCHSKHNQVVLAVSFSFGDAWCLDHILPTEADAVFGRTSREQLLVASWTLADDGKTVGAWANRPSSACKMKDNAWHFLLAYPWLFFQVSLSQPGMDTLNPQAGLSYNNCRQLPALHISPLPAWCVPSHPL